MSSKSKTAKQRLGSRSYRVSAGIGFVLFLAVLAGMRSVCAQQASEVALLYNGEIAKKAGTASDRFWLQGGAVDINVHLYSGLGIAAVLEGTTASNISTGVNLNEVTYVFGPRYTFALGPRKAGLNGFTEVLIGGVHGFDSMFPVNGNVHSSANSYAAQLGGGLDLKIRGSIGVRAIELDYVRTGLPNNGANSQNDLRLACGIYYRFHAN